jgi:hypothetical protein
MKRDPTLGLKVFLRDRALEWTAQLAVETHEESQLYEVQQVSRMLSIAVDRSCD